MNLPLPDFKDMNSNTFVMWVCAILLGFVLMIVPSSGEEAHKEILGAQKKMIEEHELLLKSMMVQCYNHAENVTNNEARARQQRRCLTLQINTQVGD